MNRLEFDGFEEVDAYEFTPMILRPSGWRILNDPEPIVMEEVQEEGI